MLTPLREPVPICWCFAGRVFRGIASRSKAALRALAGRPLTLPSPMGLNDVLRRLQVEWQGLVTPPLAIDVGANAGAWALAVLDSFPAASLLMIEAQEERRVELTEVCRRYPGCRFRIATLASVKASRQLYVCLGDTYCSGTSLLPELTGQPLQPRLVETITLDYVLDECGHAQRTVDLLKLDTQGSELDILAGAERCLERTRFLQLEVSLIRYNQAARFFHEVVAWMAERGFFLYDLFGPAYRGHRLLQVDALFGRGTTAVDRLSPQQGQRVPVIRPWT